jgi:hypothetical protein
VFILSRVPVTSCRPNELWEFVSISKSCLQPGSLGTFGCGISWSQVPGTLVVRRFLRLEDFNHHFAAHAIVRVERNRFICWTDNRVIHWWMDGRSPVIQKECFKSLLSVILFELIEPFLTFLLKGQEHFGKAQERILRLSRGSYSGGTTGSWTGLRSWRWSPKDLGKQTWLLLFACRRSAHDATTAIARSILDINILWEEPCLNSLEFAQVEEGNRSEYAKKQRNKPLVVSMKHERTCRTRRPRLFQCWRRFNISIHINIQGRHS